MKRAIAISLVLLSLMSCALLPVPVRLYGVDGANEGKVIVGTVYRTLQNTGTVEVTMPDGERCNGEYTLVQEGTSGVTSGQFHGLYETYFGTGYTQMVGRSAHGMGTAVGNRGTLLQVDFYADTRTGHGFGVAKDNKGNQYRVHF